MKVEVEIRGIEAVIKRWNSPKTKTEARRAVDRTVTQVQAIAKRYPPQAPNSTYRRTKTLGRGINKKVTLMPRGVEGRVGSNEPYAEVVNKGHGWIFPRTAKILSWVATRAAPGVARGQRIFARAVRPWEGWHNFDRAMEQGQVIFRKEIRVMAGRVRAFYDKSGKRV